MGEKINRRSLRYSVPTSCGRIQGVWPLREEPQALSRLVEFAMQLEEEVGRFGREARRGEAVTCRRGCSACCRQAVPVSAAEALFLAEHLRTFPPTRRREIARRLRASRHRWRQANAGNDAAPIHGAGLYFSLGMDCPFLENHECSIHPQRPLACREHLVVSDAVYCETLNHPFTSVLGIPLQISQGLCRATAYLANIPAAFFALISISVWVRIHPELQALRFSEEAMLRRLVFELGGTLVAEENAAVAQDSLSN